MPDSPPSAPPHRDADRIIPAVLILVALAGAGTLQWRAHRSAIAAARAIEARMAGAWDGDGPALPTRPEIESLIRRKPVRTPATARDGSIEVVYSWPGLFRSYEIRAYYSPGAIPRLVRFNAPETTIAAPTD